jgi:hypothetical protein
MAEKLKLTTVVPTAGLIFKFDCVTYQDGMPELSPLQQVQVIDSMGVDFDRQRFNRRNYKPFRAMCLVGIVNFNAATGEADRLRSKHGWVVKIEYTMAGALYTPTTTYFLSVDSAAPRPGTFLGGDVSPAGAYVEAHLTLKGTGIAPV